VIIKNNEITKMRKVVFISIIMFFCLSIFLQFASAEEPILNNIYHLQILKDNAPEFAFITAGDFLRHGMTPEGCYAPLDDRWSFNRKERFFIAFIFPPQLFGMSGTLKLMHGNKLISSKSIRTIKKGANMLGYTVSAEALFTDCAGAGIYSYEWWLGRNGDQKLAAIQLVRITD